MLHLRHVKLTADLDIRTNNATIEVIIEQDRANNSLAGYLNCPNARKQNGGDDAAKVWISNYLANGEPACCYST